MEGSGLEVGEIVRTLDPSRELAKFVS